MTQDFIDSSKEASKGGFQGIKKVRGLLSKMERVPSKFTESDFGPPKDQIEVTLEDAAVLEMSSNEELMELKEGKFTFWIPYAPPGKVEAAENSIYTKCWIETAEALGSTPKKLIGEYVTLERKPVELFKTDKDEANKPLGTDEKGNKIYKHIVVDKYFTFANEQTVDSPDVVESIKGIVVGKNKTAALRALVTDPLAKQFPDYKEALSAGTLGEMLGLKLNAEGVFEDV